MQLYGDFFRCARRLDAPSMDCLTSIPSEVPWQVGRLLSSVAELEGRAVTMSESSDHSQHYRPEGDARPKRTVSEAEIRGSLNRLIANGITTFTSYYTFEGLDSEQLSRLNTWVGRCCTLLKGGHQVTDLAVVYPSDTMQARLAPSDLWVKDAPPEAQQVQDSYDQASRALFGDARDFTYVDAQALSEAVVADGTMTLGDLSWRLIILPCVDTLPLRAWEHLAALWRSGGGVIALGAIPANSENEFPSPLVREVAHELFADDASGEIRTNAAGGFALYLGAGQQGLLTTGVNAFLAPDAILPKGAPLHVTHRRIEEHELFFVINDSADAWSGNLGISAAEDGEEWNPLTGEHTAISDPKAIALQLEPYGGMLFRFSNAETPEKHSPVAGILPGLEPRTLTATAPTLGKGEFVEATVAAAAEAGPWTASATLTKGDTDTFLFLTFSWPEDMDLSNDECLRFDLDVTERQECGQKLLAIVRDVHGVEYLCDTQVRLDIPGATRAFVPLKSFTRAGWCAAPESALDWSKIRDIRMGWGGYMGHEGEKISFRTSMPGVAGKL